VQLPRYCISIHVFTMLHQTGISPSIDVVIRIQIKYAGAGLSDLTLASSSSTLAPAVAMRCAAAVVSRRGLPSSQHCTGICVRVL